MNHDTELTVVGSAVQFHVDLKQRSLHSLDFNKYQILFLARLSSCKIQFLESHLHSLSYHPPYNIGFILFLQVIKNWCMAALGLLNHTALLCQR